MDSRRGTQIVVDRESNATATTTTETDEKKGGRGCGCWILLLLVLLGGAGATGGLVGMIVLRQETPLPGEEQIAEIATRTLMIPSEYADRRMPRVKAGDTDAERIARGRELYRVECAMCHGQTGRGDGPIGSRQFPPANNLASSDTQSKSDGQLFWILAHGMNYTGMPAWGQEYNNGPHPDDELWDLVAFVREIPKVQEASR